MLPICAAAAIVALALPARSEAQLTIYLSGGGAFPTSDYGTYAKTGWLAAGGVLFDVGPLGLSVGAEGFYGQNDHDDIEGDKTNPYGGMGIVDFSFSVGAPLVP